MQVISNRLNEHDPIFQCELCGEKLTEKELKNVIIFLHGDIEHDIQENKAFRENMRKIYIHESCMKLILDTKFHDIWETIFNKST